MTIGELIEGLVRDWPTPSDPLRVETLVSLRARCCATPITPGAELPAAVLGPLVAKLPPDLAELWSELESARLFEDPDFGQWGLVIGSPVRARALTRSFRADRAADYSPGDLVIGEFLGDSELLLARCDMAADDYGRIMVVLSIDARREWYVAGETFAIFLRDYARAAGAKFWERPA